MTSDRDTDTWHCNATCHTQRPDTWHFYFFAKKNNNNKKNHILICGTLTNVVS